MTRRPAHLSGAAGETTSGGLAWVVSTQSTHYRNSRTEVETLLRQRMRPEERELPAALRKGRAAERLRGQAALRAPAAGRAAAAERGGGVRGLRRHAAPRLEAPRHLRRGGARVLRVAQRADARAELAGRPGGQLRPGAEGAPHRVLLGLRRALLHVQGREAGAGAAGGARALPEADPAAHPRVEAL